jgi:hypothetical protein
MTIQKKTTNSNTNQTKRLSVQITLTGLSFLIASPEGEVLFFSEKKFDTPHTPEELLFELTQIISEEEALRDDFESVTLIYTTQNYAVVPSSLFDETKASEYLKFNTKILQNDYISYDEVANDPSVVVYVPFVNINNYIFEQFGSFQYYHAGTLLVQYLLNTEKHSQQTKVFLHVLPQQFECIILSQGKLQMCNSYLYQTPEDFIYYILFCFEQLKLNPDIVETVLCGDISTESELYEILYTYIRHVSFLEHSLPKITTEPSHQHFLLKTTL